MVVRGAGVLLLVRGRAACDVSVLLHAGVTLSACGFGLRAHDLTLTDLVAGVVEVDSAARCVAHRRRQGWLFIRG